jgi:hypothetical protein
VMQGKLRNTRRRLAVFGGVTGAAAAAALGAIWTLSPRAGTPPSLAVLSLPSTPIPDSIFTSYAADIVGEPSNGHLAFSRNGKMYYVAVGSPSTVCLFVYDIRQGADADAFSANTCGDTEGLNDGIIYIKMPEPDGSGMDIVGLVADGYTTASVGGTSSVVTNNVFAIQGATLSSEVDVSGPAGKLSVDTGPVLLPSNLTVTSSSESARSAAERWGAGGGKLRIAYQRRRPNRRSEEVRVPSVPVTSPAGRPVSGNCARRVVTAAARRWCTSPLKSVGHDKGRSIVRVRSRARGAARA